MTRRAGSKLPFYFLMDPVYGPCQIILNCSLFHSMMKHMQGFIQHLKRIKILLIAIVDQGNIQDSPIFEALNLQGSIWTGNKKA